MACYGDSFFFTFNVTLQHPVAHRLSADVTGSTALHAAQCNSYSFLIVSPHHVTSRHVTSRHVTSRRITSHHTIGFDRYGHRVD
jgi:hypothetical protein